MSKHPFQNFVVRFPAEAAIYREGEAGATMYIVQSGRVSLYRQVDEVRRDLGVMEKGDFFGEMSILEGLPRMTSAEASEDTELIEINSLTFDKMIKGNIEIAIRMLRKLSIRLREAERNAFALQTAGGPSGSFAAPPAAALTTSGDVDRTGVRLEAEDSDTVYHLRELETLVGRYDPVTELMPDVDLTLVDLKRSVSRRHARIVNHEGGYIVIEEVGALNGTFVNGARLVTGQAHPLTDGDKVSMGTVKMQFRI